GLFISDDGGRVWRTVQVFRGPNGAPLPLRPGSSVFAVQVTDDGTLWIGTGDGLLASTDGGTSWTLFRASVPTTPPGDLDDDLEEEVPEVETYAYPNPFSPRADRLVRIRYEGDAAGSVRVRIFDFAMRLIAELDEGDRGSGPNEVLWTGLADDGTRVANGPYLYVVDAGGQQVSGKILVLD
ncbi:MAG: FlgD immunoglobulin-like domain containing protein, partial [Bacteroidota bacterium]